MMFTTVYTTQVQITESSAEVSIPCNNLLNGGNVIQTAITPAAGRIFFAGMLFDRLRIRSVQCTIRPRTMPAAATASNYIVYAAWDRYGYSTDPAVSTSYSIQSDPSCKQVVWTPGGSGSPLRTWIYATYRDRFQFLPIVHNASLISWNFGTASVSNGPAAPFLPSLLLSFNAAIGETPVVISYSIFTRITIEFSGAYSNNTLNAVSPTNGASVASTVPLEERIAALERMAGANPADNNDDLVSVLNELSAPQ